MYVIPDRAKTTSPLTLFADVDRPASPSALTHIRNLVKTHVTSNGTSHPHVPASPDISLNNAMRTELERIGCKEPLRAVETSRYEEPELSDDASLDEARKQLQVAYTSLAYLRGRNEELALLEQYGKNAYLLQNYHLEAELRALEKELVETRETVGDLNRARKSEQESARHELEGLEGDWKKGIGELVRIQVALQQKGQR